MTSFCTASIFSMRLTQSSDSSSGRIERTRAACSGRNFETRPQRSADIRSSGSSPGPLPERWRAFPHVAACRTADFVHDAADTLGRRILLEQAFRGVVGPSSARDADMRLTMSSNCSTNSASIVPSDDITMEISRNSSSSSRPKIWRHIVLQATASVPPLARVQSACAGGRGSVAGAEVRP